MPRVFVFDIESVGLYGEGFAVSWTVQDGEGNELDAGYLGAPIESAQGLDADREWVMENVCPHLPRPNCPDTDYLRTMFWEKLQYWRSQPGGCQFYAECGYPVEASFLIACVKQASEADPDAKWKAPYPLHDVASVMLAAGMDPMATYARGPDELPAHHPLADARLSARLLREAFASLVS